jgi:prepilin-type N-terminal cleavage/methylation domain-containing protein
MRRQQDDGCEGYTLIELLLATSLIATLAGISVPLASGTVDALRASGAARHMAARIATIRLDAVRRATTVALRFDRQGSDYTFTTFVDGNGNGVRAADVTQKIDLPLTSAERLRDHFPGTSFGLLPGLPDLDGGTASSDGVRIGSSSFLSTAPNGSATGGTLYIHGRRRQYAVRVLGATGRVRLFVYDLGARRWIQK